MTSDCAPRILVKPTLRQENDGSKLVFFCEIEASPAPTIQWFKGDTKLVESERLKYKLSTSGADGRTHTISLEIEDVNGSDSGQYKVNVSNALGNVSASIALNFGAGDEQQLTAYAMTTRQ